MLEGVVRESTSKSEVKALRRDGYLIANIYGKGVENIHCAFKKNEFIRAVKQKTSLIFPVKLSGKEVKVVVQEYQKDPITSDLLHVDLMVATNGVTSKFFVPVRVSGTPKGLRNKGVLIMSKKRIKVKCKPENLPEEYFFDVTPLDVGEAYLIRDIPEHEGVIVFEKVSDAVVGVIKAK